MAKGSQKTPSKRAKELLVEAAEIMGDRGLAYGEPSINHLRIAHFWSVYFERAIEPHEVAMAMALVKIARLMETRTGDSGYDSVKDGAAYLAIFGELANKDWTDLDTF